MTLVDHPAVASWEAFAIALAAMGLLFLLWPEGAPWLGLALVLGSLYGLERRASGAGIPGPLADLGVSTKGA